jgi:hypothetical protein
VGIAEDIEAIETAQVVRLPLAPTNIPPAADDGPRVVVAKFRTTAIDLSIDSRSRTKLGLLIPRWYKHMAIAATEWPGIELEWEVTRPLTPDEHDI